MLSFPVFSTDHNKIPTVTTSYFERFVSVNNLFNKGDVFGDMICHPVIFSIMSRFLGSEFVAGSYCASRLLPGCPGQEPHIDYPYWDLYKSETFPTAINATAMIMPLRTPIA